MNSIKEITKTHIRLKRLGFIFWPKFGGYTYEIIPYLHILYKEGGLYFIILLNKDEHITRFHHFKRTYVTFRDYLIIWMYIKRFKLPIQYKKVKPSN